MENSSRKKKILLVCPSLGIGGRERIAVNTFETLRNYYDVDLAVFMRKEKEYAFDGDLIDLDAYTEHGRVNKAFIQLKRAIRIARYVKKNQVDIVLGFGEASNTSISLAKKFGVKKVVSIVHGFGEINNLKRMKFILSLTDAAVCISKEMKSELLNRYNPQCSVYTIENGYNIKDIKKKSEHDAEKLSGTPAFVAMGRIEDVKGYDRMLHAFSIILNRYPNAELTILGDGSKKEDLIQYLKELKIDDHVHFVGNRENPYCVLKQADLFLLTSRNEGFPNALIEALACGVPIVSVACQSGPTEILSGQYEDRCIEGFSFEKYGVLVQNKEENVSEIFADAVKSVLSDESKLIEYRKLADKRAEEFSTEAYTLKMKSMIEEVLCE